MKTTIQCIFLTITLFIAFISINYLQTHYSRYATVTYLNECMDEVELTDNTGNIWVWCDDTEKYTIGDCYQMKMHNNYTDFDITDDIILTVLEH